MIILDSDILIDFLRGTLPGGVERLMELQSQGHTLTTTTISAYEILVGEKLYGTEAAYAKARETLVRLHPLSLDFKAAEELARLDGELTKAGFKLDLKDLMIASIALANGATLLTKNQKHFSRVKDLKTDGG